MSIQSTINQGISVASLLISQNPEIQASAKKRAEINDLRRQRKDVASALQSMKPGLSVPGKTAEETEADFIAVGEKGVAVAQEMFEKAPTMERYSNVKELEGSLGKIKEQKAEREKAALEFEEMTRRAEEATKVAQEERRRARAAIYIPESYGAPRERIKYGEE